MNFQKSACSMTSAIVTAFLAVCFISLLAQGHDSAAKRYPSTISGKSLEKELRNHEISEIKLTRQEVLKQKELYITVGKKGCDYKTIKEALKAVDERRYRICIMDAMHIESGILIDKDVMINGFGKQFTTIGAAASGKQAKDRVFMIEKDTKVCLKWMKICNGYTYTVPRCGAGVYNKGKLKLTNCEISGNRATYGVGINNEGILYMDDCTVLRNNGLKRPLADTLQGTDCGGSGAGLKVERNGKAYLARCQFSENNSVANGGGLHISCEGYASLTNCTFAENTGKLRGGGINVMGDLDLVHCTVANNQSKVGCGVFVMGRLNMSASLVANNSDSDLVLGSGSGVYGQGEVGKNEYNFMGKSSIKAFRTGDPGLETLRSNGGETLTMALKKGSKAINGIPQNAGFCIRDQRGRSRNDGFEDIGAFELKMDDIR